MVISFKGSSLFDPRLSDALVDSYRYAELYHSDSLNKVGTFAMRAPLLTPPGTEPAGPPRSDGVSLAGVYCEA
jgi:hypothetical protein